MYQILMNAIKACYHQVLWIGCSILFYSYGVFAILRSCSFSVDGCTGALDDAVRVFSGIASTIKYLHGKKIVHNDIKPANVLYDPARGPVLIDFGLVTALGDLPVRGGTPWYIPDELLSSDSRGPESDVFALGVDMLYMLKKLPLPESTGPQWHIGSIRNDPTPMRRWLDKIVDVQRGLEPKGLEGIVKDTLIALPNKRISADDVIHRQSLVINHE